MKKLKEYAYEHLTPSVIGLLIFIVATSLIDGYWTHRAIDKQDSLYGGSISQTLKLVKEVDAKQNYLNIKEKVNVEKRFELTRAVEGIVLKLQELQANQTGLGEVLDSIDRIDGIRFEELVARAQNGSKAIEELTIRSNRHNEVLVGILSRQKENREFIKNHGHSALVKKGEEK